MTQKDRKKNGERRKTLSKVTLHFYERGRGSPDLLLPAARRRFLALAELVESLAFFGGAFRRSKSLGRVVDEPCTLAALSGFRGVFGGPWRGLSGAFWGLWSLGEALAAFWSLRGLWCALVAHFSSLESSKSF